MSVYYVWVRSLGQEDPLEKEMETHCRIPWTEEPEGLQSMGSQRLGQDLATKTQQCAMCNVWVSTHTYIS